MSRTFSHVVAALAILGIAYHADAGGRRLQSSSQLLHTAVPLRDSPQPTGIPSRNRINLLDRDLATSWSVEENKFKNIKWCAELGTCTYGTPVVAHGRVFVATNAKFGKGYKAALMALRESDGKFLWQIVHDYPDPFSAYVRTAGGMVSTPAIDDRSLYYVTAAGEVICAASALGKVAWRYDMMKELKVVPCTPPCFLDHLPLGSPLVVGDLVFVITGNGRDDDEKLMPNAPSLIALQKQTGKLVWQSNLPGDNIMEGQWSSPTFAVVNNVPQVIFGGGDGVVYGLEPESGRLIWKCKCNPAAKKKEMNDVENYIVGAPVVVGDRLYVGLGHTDYPKPSRSSYFLCLDITRRGDVSFMSYDAKSSGNKNYALVWAFGGPIEPRPEKGRRAHFGSTSSTAAIHDGLVYISEKNGYLYCLDANTGERYWAHDLKDVVYGSPYWVDGKIYLGTESGDVCIFAHGKTKRLVATIEMDDMMQSSPTAANGVLFVMTKSKLYAIK